jgi:hypothetical protein
MDVREFHKEIAKLAYELFEVNGYEHGNDLAHWFEAERLVVSRHAVTEEKPKRKRAVGKPLGKKTAIAKGKGASASKPASRKKKTT